MLTKNVLKKDGKLVGLIVLEAYARRFLEGAEERKVYEIRRAPVRFLKEGDRIALISVSKTAWTVIGILEYQDCIRIKNALFEKHFPLHRVSQTEYETFRRSWSNPHQDHCFAWHFDLVHAFVPGLQFKERVAGPVTWCHFRLDDLQTWKGKRSAESSESISLDTSKRIKHSDSGSSQTVPDSCVENVDQGLLVCANRAVVPDDCGAVQDDCQAVEDGCEEIHYCELVPDSESQTHCMCIIFTALEWRSLCSGGTSLLKPFRPRDPKLHVLVQRDSGLFFVGMVEVEVANFTVVEGGDLSAWSDTYSKYDLKHLSTLKRLWQWNIASVNRVDIESEVRPMTKAHNRTFRKSMSDFRFAPAKPPESLSLLETARYFFEQVGEDYQGMLLQSLRPLSGKTIRIGTTCSGSDICVSVLKDTIQYFNTTQSLGSK